MRTVLPCLTERAGRLAPICSAAIEALTASRDAVRSVVKTGQLANI